MPHDAHVASNLVVPSCCPLVNRPSPFKIRPPPVRLPCWWAHHRDLLDLLSPFCISSKPLAARSPGDGNAHSPCTPRPPLYSFLTRGGKRPPCLTVRPLAFGVIYQFLCLAAFADNPPERSHQSHINPTCAFYRSNPEFYPFPEHYLLCLANLFC
jgi:hypothetical protein